MRLLAATVVSLLLASPALAGSGNVLTIAADPSAANRIDALLTGDDNRLTLSQTRTSSEGEANTINVRVNGHRNGTGRGQATLIADLPWGTLTQSGNSNVMEVSITGSDNLLAAVQRGSSNVMKTSISGDANWAAISQTGQNNLASFSQTGNGNMIAITQRSW
ncbi:hypothetical protein NS226_07555 [Aureimonas ureilytica]|uniref:Curlin n=2 Tax=Aureimonas ureilytica TaxID=401562 RepID=A0A175RC13_9HYPH|nr:hypothetical protein NS226_07555 [Aureimonas ureilytica]